MLTDIMFVNKLPFLVNISRRLKFATIEYLSRKNEIALVTPINKIVSYYISHGLHLSKMFVEPEVHSLEEWYSAPPSIQLESVNTSQK